jgi:fatty-acyl-CoA synthase
VTGKPIFHSPSAYGHPLLIRNLFRSAVAQAPEQEIVYGNRKRLTYREFGERVCRLASALAELGVVPGQTIGVMDWDSHRYLECFFANPMRGAVLHTINVRLSPERILYTINHADDDMVLVDSEFVPVLEGIWDRADPGKKLVLLNDAPEAPTSTLPLAALLQRQVADVVQFVGACSSCELQSLISSPPQPKRPAAVA